MNPDLLFFLPIKSFFPEKIFFLKKTLFAIMHFSVQFIVLPL